MRSLQYFLQLISLFSIVMAESGMSYRNEFHDIDLVNGTTLRSIFQITLATIFGICIGGERRLHTSKVTKMGPYTLICVASCLFTIVSRNLTTVDSGKTDPTRIASAVVTGVGFIGAGFIVRLNNNIIVGMTDASVIWISAGIGMAVGFEYYILASYTLVMIMIILNTGRIFRLFTKEPSPRELHESYGNYASYGTINSGGKTDVE